MKIKIVIFCYFLALINLSEILIWVNFTKASGQNINFNKKQSIIYYVYGDYSDYHKILSSSIKNELEERYFTISDTSMSSYFQKKQININYLNQNLDKIFIQMAKEINSPFIHDCIILVKIRSIETEAKGLNSQNDFWEALVHSYIEFINVKTGKIATNYISGRNYSGIPGLGLLLAKSVVLKKENAIEVALENLAEKIFTEFVKFSPVYCRILTKTNEHVVVDIGSISGIKTGTPFDIFYLNEKQGSIVLYQVNVKNSRAFITNGESRINTGMIGIEKLKNSFTPNAPSSILYIENSSVVLAYQEKFSFNPCSLPSISFFNDDLISIDQNKINMLLMNNQKDELISHDDLVTDFLITPNKNFLISSSLDSQIKLLNISDWKESKAIKTESPIVNICISSDSKILVTNHYDNITRLWSVPDLKILKTIDNKKSSINFSAISPNNKLLASGCNDNKILIWDLNLSTKPVILKGHLKAVRSLLFYNNGETLISSGEDGTIRIWDIIKQKEVKFFKAHSLPIHSITISPDERFLVSGGAGKVIRLWDISNWTEIASFKATDEEINSICFHPDSLTLAAASIDGEIKTWDLQKIPQIEERIMMPSELITEVIFRDEKSFFPNNILDASEEAMLCFKIINKGNGTAYDVVITLEKDNSMVYIRDEENVGNIPPQSFKELSVPLILDMNAASGFVLISINTNEKRGYNARPIKIEIPVRHLEKPILEFASFSLNDGYSGTANGNGNGIVENGETIEITAFVKNIGVGSSLNTVADIKSISPGLDIRFEKINLGKIDPSETKQAKFVITIPRTYSGTDLKLVFAARDTIGASQITKEHIVPMSKLAPILVCDSRFLDSRGVQVDEVSNGNSYILEIVPRNEGQLAARSVQAKITASPGVNLTNSQSAIGDVPAGAVAAPIRFNFNLSRNYNLGLPRFDVRLSQIDFAELSQKMDIPFRLKSPNLVTREIINTTDGNSDIQQSETVDIDLVIENQGDLDAEGVVADLNFTHTGIDFRDRSKTLGRIPAGGLGRVRFSFLVKTGATVGPLSGQLQVRQTDGFASVSKALSYTINAIGAQIVTVTPTEQPGAVQRMTPTARVNTPPVVFLSLKNLGTEGKSYEPYVKLEIQIKDDKAMLAIEPEIRVNGRLQPKEQGLRGIGLEERQAKEDELKLKLYRLVELSEGLNDIEVRVYDSDNEMGMENTEVEYVSKRTDIWAIVVGVGDYQNDQIEDLKFAAADAQIFYDFVKSPEGGNLPTDHIKLLLNRDATRENILRDMEWLSSKAFENDVVYIYMAMHGMVDQGELYFVAHNSDPGNLLATGVKKRDLEGLIQSRMRSNKIVWFADACHSGSLGEDTQVSMRASRASATNRLLTEISRARNGLAMFMSATAAEFSQEGTKWGGGHGVFTHFLLQGLRGLADKNKDNYVSVTELYDYVSRQVSDATAGKQNPILRGNYDRELPLSTVK